MLIVTFKTIKCIIQNKNFILIVKFTKFYLIELHASCLRASKGRGEFLPGFRDKKYLTIRKTFRAIYHGTSLGNKGISVKL